MPRDHARIQTAIWQDRDFRSLPRDAQHLYFVLLSQPTLSYCGVLDWWPNRLAALSAGATEDEVYNAAKSLFDAKFIDLDGDTSELMIRTYIKHDGVMQRANMGKAMARAMEKVVSLDLHERIQGELSRLYQESPGLAGWDGLADVAPDVFEDVTTGAMT